ncbi:hypothetical protein RJT34_18778 [Clitoria ternatea]|uniref:Uncharacterized protein n=1 Tax=Clitoria ternatea TaxID=43366 RepID=A0AAN9PFR9_CLITE
MIKLLNRMWLGFHVGFRILEQTGLMNWRRSHKPVTTKKQREAGKGTIPCCVTMVVNSLYLCMKTCSTNMSGDQAFDGKAPGSAEYETSRSSGAGTATAAGLTGIMVAKSMDFSYQELAKATNNFNLDNKIGQGGFGVVYYAELRGEFSSDLEDKLKRVTVENKKLADMLIVGSLVYASSAHDEPLAYFSKFRYYFPDHVNPAEYLVDLVKIPVFICQLIHQFGLASHMEETIDIDLLGTFKVYGNEAHLSLNLNIKYHVWKKLAREDRAAAKRKTFKVAVDGRCKHILRRCFHIEHRGYDLFFYEEA